MVVVDALSNGGDDVCSTRIIRHLSSSNGGGLVVRSKIDQRVVTKFPGKGARPQTERETPLGPSFTTCRRTISPCSHLEVPLHILVCNNYTDLSRSSSILKPFRPTCRPPDHHRLLPELATQQLAPTSSPWPSFWSWALVNFQARMRHRC